MDSSSSTLVHIVYNNTVHTGPQLLQSRPSASSRAHEVERNMCAPINRIGNFNLFSPMVVFVEYIDGEYIASAPDIPQVYGCGDLPTEAVEMLKDEILSLWHDLNEDDEFSDELLSLRDFLRKAFCK